MKLYHGTCSRHLERIDELSSAYAVGWSLERMPAVDRAILRLAAYEVLWRTDIPDPVAIAEAVGLAAALDYIDHVGRLAIHAHEAQLTAYAQECLSQIEGLRIYGNAPDKGPIVAFDIAGAHAHDIATIIDRAGVAVRQRHGRLFVCDGAAVPAAWAANVWEHCVEWPVESIGSAARALRGLQRNWAMYAPLHHRRAALIAEQLPKVSAKPLVFGMPAPTAPLPLTPSTVASMVASPRTSPLTLLPVTAPSTIPPDM